MFGYRINIIVFYNIASSPGSIISSNTPALVAITGTPELMASIGVSPKPSHRCGAIYTSSERKISGRFSVGCSPKKRILCPNPSALLMLLNHPYSFDFLGSLFRR